MVNVNDYDRLFRQFLREILEEEHAFNAPLYIIRGEGSNGYDPIIDYYFSHKESLRVDGTVEQTTVAAGIIEFTQYSV